MSLSLRQIRYFIATAEAGQLSLAASTLGVSQSAVTEAIKSLERETGAQLFRRHAKGVFLTLEGNQFLQHARNILAAVSDATRAPRRSRSELTGSFSLAVTFTVAGYFMAAPLARFRRLFPGVEPVLHELDRADIEQGLVDGRIDLALFLVSNLRNAAAIDTEVLIQSKRRLWLPVNHPLLQPKRVALGDVAPEPYIMLTIDEADRTAMRYWRPRASAPTSSSAPPRSRRCAAWWRPGPASPSSPIWSTGPGRSRAAASRCGPSRIRSRRWMLGWPGAATPSSNPAPRRSTISAT